MSEGVDYPTTGGWGQSDAQWKGQKTNYERLIDTRNKLRDQTNRYEQKRDAVGLMLDTIREYVEIMGSDIPDAEISELRIQWTYLSKKKDLLTEQLNDSRNALKRQETDVHNFKQRR
jgi:hypothetical protein